MDSSCCANPGAKQTHLSEGSEEEIAGIKTYQTGQGQSAIVLFTDIFGYAFPNTRKVADRFANETQSVVFIPDCFEGDPMNINLPNFRDLLPEWLEKHPVTVACQIAERFLSAIQDQYQTIQVIGFCYGGKVVVYLISQSELSSRIEKSIVGHPSMLIEEEARQIRRPILFLCAEYDYLFSNALEDHFKAVLTENGLGRFRKYPGTIHGFIVRPDGSAQSKESSEQSIEDAIEYFQKKIDPN